MSLFLTIVVCGLVALGCGRTEMDKGHMVGSTGGDAGQSSSTGSMATNPPAGRDGGPAGAGTGGAGQSGAGGAGQAGAGGRSSAGGRGGAGAETGGTSPGGGRGGAGTSGASPGGGRGGAGAGGTVQGGSAAGAGATGSSEKPRLWRNSRDAFCPQTTIDAGPIYVWSDGRGVFVSTSNEKGTPTIWSNTGTGWQTFFAWPEKSTSLDQGQGGLSGLPDGSLILYGGRPCGLQLVDSQGAHCSGDALYVKDVAVVNSNLAYAVSLDRLLQFDGDFWTQVGDPLGLRENSCAVWADSEIVVATSGNGQIYTIQSGKDPVPLPGLPVVYPVATWGFGASDIWVASAEGQLFHHDGKQWSLKASLAFSGAKYPLGPRMRLWGQGATLFVIFGNLFGRWDGTRVEVLDSLDGNAYFEGLWGNSPAEVFLGVHGPDLSGACPLRTRWWNGKTVGPL